jgi:hypothetical protein
MQAKAVMQATTGTPVTCNSKDNSNIMTSYSSRNANNSRYESNDSSVNTVMDVS